jgi:serine protease Do
VIFVLAAVALSSTLASCSFGGNEPKEKAQNVAPKSSGASTAAPEDQPVARVAEQLSPSVVQVNVRAVQVTPFGTAQESEGLGSGVIYREDGYIVTNSHVVAPQGSRAAEEVNVAFADGSQERGEVVGRDPSTELAVIRVNRGGLPAARFDDGADLVVGELAVAIGSPSGFRSTVTAGVISGLNREVPARYTRGRQDLALVDLIQTDAAISPGSSGGALADRDGEVVGINVAYLPPQEGAESIGFAIPSDTVTSVADQLIENGRVSSPFLGSRFADLTPQIAERFGLSAQNGVIVVDVELNGPADDAGLRPRDLITAIDSTRIEDTGDLLAALRDYEPGDTAALTVIREGTGDEERVEVRLGERE